MAATSVPKVLSDPHPTPTTAFFQHDVYLSFAGKDTRKSFIGRLNNQLIEVGIRPFADDLKIQVGGGDISLELMRAIEESRIYIVVFSKNYAFSRWCLDELVKIMECKRINGQVVLPVFYGVEPSEVRRQNQGSFAEAFEKHRTRYPTELNRVKGWQDALEQAGAISGFHLQTSALGSESRLINMIVKEVVSQVKPKRLLVVNNPVGLDSRLNEVYSLIRLESGGVRLIGIWGMGGSGKTVIAKALYNDIYQNFDSSCFLANVREVSQKPNGLVHLQEQLISELVRGKEVKVGNVDIGMEIISVRLHRKKVLIILDDLDKANQVDALAGNRDWFGLGSVIIITTRDQQLLNQVQVDGRYEAKQLNNDEALELFSLHAFKKEFPEEPYAIIADKLVAYSCGLPLALVVLGSYLFGRSIQQWKSAFEKLQQIPLTDIQNILQISYEGLDHQEREIFLDIACFFIGMDIDYVTEILNSCGFSTEFGIEILQERGLLTVDRNNKVRMHDLLRDMGREIIRLQCPEEPGKRSRLWSHQDVTNVLMRDMGTKAVEGVTLVSPIKEEIHLNTTNFARMHNLRLLQMDNVNLDGSFKHLSANIRWISWQNCPLEHLPSDLQLGNLVTLDMKHSKMSTVWQANQIQLLRHLKILDLSHSKRLTSTPDFTRVPNLVTLILEGCTSLIQIDPSIGSLNSLLVLNLKGCEKITYIPSEICNLRLLGYLNLSGCSNLKELPQDIGSIESLRDLYADETLITCLPLSLRNLRNRDYMSSSAPSFPVPHPTPTPEPISDVFLSCRGLGTQNSFTSHLYDRLVMAGIHTFMDDRELRKGTENSLELMRAIEESRMYIVVFSENYASSIWRLEELVKIMEYHGTMGRVVVPVFYGVQPSDVRRQKGRFEEAFRSHEARYFDQLEMVNKWRSALTKAADLSGFDLQGKPLGSESSHISLIVNVVLSQVKPKKQFVAKHQVGVDSRVNDVYSLLTLDSDDHVYLIGIWGMGGSGKTVIARALYNKLLQSFYSSCFLAKVREVSGQLNGVLHLQEQLISKLTMRDIANIHSVDRGIEMIKEKLCHERVLIVLDDLDKASQVDALVGDRNWFGGGSVIIITTRDKHLLNEIQVDAIYPTQELNDEEALELFTWHSFGSRYLPEPYAVLADKIIHYSQGLPLALEVLGASLFGRPIQVWENAFENSLQNTFIEIQSVLKISYDGLEDDELRDIFLDVACFFIGMDIDYATDILKDYSSCPEAGIQTLKERCLLTVNGKNELRMHNFLRDMGTRIVGKPFPKEPGEHRRQRTR